MSTSPERVMVRLEDGTGLWRELELDGTKLTQRSRVYDGQPQNTSTRFESLAEAKDQLAFLIGRYQKQGYKEVSRTSGPAPAPADLFVSHPEYEAACVAAPDDPRPWRIYADWLQEKGDPRGELAALLLADQEVAAWDLLETARDSLVGPHSERELLDLVMTHGFITGATLKRASAESDTKLAAMTKDFLGRPAARFVTQLKFGLAEWRHGNEWTSTLKAVCAAPQAAQLRKLEFNAFEHQTWELHRIDFGAFSAIWSALPALEHLHLRASTRGKLGRIQHSKLKTLIREADFLRREEVDAILHADLPALERLDLWTGVGTDAEATTDQFADVLEGKRFPRLTHLGVVYSELTVELVRALAKSSLLPRLRVLDLSKGAFTDAEVDVLLPLAPKFAHLERLDLSENFFSERLEEVRRAFPRAALKDQRTEADRYDDAGE